MLLSCTFEFSLVTVLTEGARLWHSRHSVGCLVDKRKLPGESVEKTISPQDTCGFIVDASHGIVSSSGEWRINGPKLGRAPVTVK